MTDQAAKDIAARVEHELRQRGVAAREWQRQAEQHEASLQKARERICTLETAAHEVVSSMSRPLGYTDAVTLVDTALLRQLERCVSSHNASAEPSPIEETQARCPRCGAALNNLSPGISVVAGGVSVCTSCLNPGEYEVARAR